jgi:hypothetical protein
MYGSNQKVDKEQINLYIDNFESNEDVDCQYVRDTYKSMAEVLINDYVRYNMPTEVEPFVKYEMYPGYFPSGSIDNITGDCIVDYKTYNSKIKPKTITVNYKYQLLIYAYICRMNGIDINRIRLVYINRPIDGRYISEKTGKQCGKIHPPEVTVLTEQITDEDIQFIESLLRLCIETVQTAKANPNLVYLLFKDYRLKDSNERNLEN